MKVDKNTVESIAELAQLGFSDEDTEEYIGSMSNILDLVEEMQAVDTDHVEAMAHPLDRVQRLRPDVISETDQHEEFQSTAPLTEASLYLVPKVLE